MVSAATHRRLQRLGTASARFAATVAGLFLCGCHTTRVSPLQIAALYDQGRPAEALKVLADGTETPNHRAGPAALDRSILLLMSGRPEAAVRELEPIRRHLDFVRQQDFTEQVQSMLTDERAISWSGRDFERQMVNNIQLLAGILAGSRDTQAFATRSMAAVHHQKRVSDVPAEGTSTDADTSPDVPPFQEPPVSSASRMTAWLAASVSSEHMHNADLTDRLLQQVAAWQDTGESPGTSFRRLGTQAGRGFGVLQVVTFSGRITPWEEESVEPTTTALLIADQILSATGEYSLPPTVSDVTIARPVHSSAPRPFRTRVVVPDGPSAADHRLVDLNHAAWQSWRAERDRQIARAVVRRIVKKSAVYTLKDSLQITRHGGTDLLLSLTGVLWEALEQADLRYWTLLPAAVDVATVELPEGTHSVVLQVVPADSPTAAPVHTQEISVDIRDGRNTFVVCFRPRQRLVRVLSGPNGP